MAVTEGHVLARLDDATQRSYLALAELEVRHEEARLNLDRQRRLLDLRLIGQAGLDGKGRQTRSRRGSPTSASRVVVAEREIDVRRTALEDTVIRGPFSGVAVSTHAQPGEMISPVSAGGGLYAHRRLQPSSTCVVATLGGSGARPPRSSRPHARGCDPRRLPDWEIPTRVITTIPAPDRQRATVLMLTAFDDLGDSRLPACVASTASGVLPTLWGTLWDRLFLHPHKYM